MLPPLEGVIARRVLINFRADPQVVRALVPAPFEVVTQEGAAVVGVCLIRLAQLRPKGLAGFVGIASDSMAHRVAVRCPTPEGFREGVFVWQRHSDTALLTLLGGRLFPGVHHRARFHSVEGESGLRVEAFTGQSRSDVSVSARRVPEWRPTPLFPTLEAARAFFARGDRGVSCSPGQRRLEAAPPGTLEWSPSPLAVSHVRVAFFEDRQRFPGGSIAFDGAVLMHAVPHGWHDLSVVPELTLAEAVSAAPR
ncbi:MAG TPA: DUF2071 domain-containing protein [Thermodesulfobacteriota bacterium]